ncbi:twitching motility protein PilT [Nitrospira sp.]|nr:twitching motility protein PilT [Nitrospira sp.]
MDISQLLSFGVKEGASDCHLSAGEPPMLRLHGDLKKVDMPPLTQDQVHGLVYDIMSDAQRKIFEEHLEADFSFALGEVARFRVNVFMQNRGLAAVFRTIPTEIIPLERLGMPPMLRQLCDREKGLILVTGPTGSGKSTTLAAMVDYLNSTFEGHVITIEDPIEFVHHSKKCLVNQRELGVQTKSFSNALRSALREDPDIILVGEMRDLETIQLALTAAETGHLVFGTLHTSSAPKTVDRIIDAFPPNQQAQVRTQLSEALEAILTQSLVKKKNGGRVAAVEILVATTAIRNLIREQKLHQIPGLMQASQKEGMQTMDMALMDLVSRGLITKSEAQSRSMNPNLFNNIVGTGASAAA